MADKTRCLFLWMLHVWLSEEKTRKMPSKHNRDYSLGLWDSSSLCSVNQKQLESASSSWKTNEKENLFLLLVMHGWLTAFILFTAALCRYFDTCKLLWQTCCWPLNSWGTNDKYCINSQRKRFLWVKTRFYQSFSLPTPSHPRDSDPHWLPYGLVRPWTHLCSGLTGVRLNQNGRHLHKNVPTERQEGGCGRHGSRQEKLVRISSLQSCLFSKGFFKSLLNMFIFLACTG